MKRTTPGDNERQQAGGDDQREGKSTMVRRTYGELTGDIGELATHTGRGAPDRGGATPA